MAPSPSTKVTAIPACSAARRAISSAPASESSPTTRPVGPTARASWMLTCPSPHLRAAGLVDVRERTVVNPMPSVQEKLFIAQLLDNMREAILTSGAATTDELDDLRAAVRAAAERPDTVFLQARIHQVSGRRP